MNTQTAARTTQLEWLPPDASNMPEPGERVLAIVRMEDGSEDWDTVWWDGTLHEWLLSEDAVSVPGDVVLIARVTKP